MRIIRSLKENYLIILILALGAFLRFYKLDFQSIWLDEIHTMIECNPKLSFKEFYDIMIFREQMPHLYFLSVKAFSIIFGHTTLVIRAVSAIIGLLSIYSIYLLGKELDNRKTGLISALFLSVNYFHILYSQEARPYVLLALFAILSFYRLVKLIKKSSLKNSLLYGLFAALMINTHFFGLFILVSQCVIILFFMFDLPKSERFNFFKFSALSGILTLILWYPSIKIFLLVTQIKSFWIQPPTLEVYTQMFKEFFGNSELVLLLVFLTGTFYFMSLFNQKKEKKETCRDNKMLLGFMVLSIWIFITLFIPLVRTYLDIPMIISRYFIGVLPALILIIAIGISNIKSELVQRIVVLIFVVASLTDIIIIKDYYNKTSKTQFREITETIIKRNKKKEKVVSSTGWLLSYFLNQDITNKPLLGNSSEDNVTVDNSLEGYIAQMKNSNDLKESFWYIDGNSKEYKLNAEDEQFLNDNFILAESIAKYDTWTRHYISKNPPKKDSSGLRLRDFTPGNFDSNGNLLIFENSIIKSSIINLQKGKYNLTINANSLPDKPINGENAHFIIKVIGEEIGNYYLSEKLDNKTKTMTFECKSDRKARVLIVYDNDVSVNNLDRNAIIYSVALEKK